MEDAQRGSERCFELLQAGDADGLRRILEKAPDAAEARDATGVSLLMHSIYRGRRDLAELIASKKRALDIFEAASLGRLDHLKECIRDASAIAPHSIDSHSKDGFTPLHFACFFGQLGPPAAGVRGRARRYRPPQEARPHLEERTFCRWRGLGGRSVGPRCPFGALAGGRRGARTRACRVETL